MHWYCIFVQDVFLYKHLQTSYPVDIFVFDKCLFFLPQDFSQCQLSAGFAQKAQPVAAWFTVSLSQLLQVGIGGWLKLQMGLADMLDRNPGMRNVRIKRKMKFVNNSVHFDSED